MKFFKVHWETKEIRIGRLNLHVTRTRYFGLGFRFWHWDNLEVLLFKLALDFRWLHDEGCECDIFAVLKEDHVGRTRLPESLDE